MIGTKMQQREAKGKALALGLLLLALMAAFVLLTARPAHAASFTVNSTADGGDDNPGNGSCFTGTLIPGSGFGLVKECTLRAAIEETNATSGADTINFNIPSTGVNTISVGHQGCCRLPAITEQVTIDGYSQPGSMPNTLASGNNATLKIELEGTNASPGGGLNLATDGSVIKGLVINRFLYGVVISGPTVGVTAKSNMIEGNFIGTDASGTQDLGNVRDGVAIFEGANNTIGGTEAGARNIISGNGGGGGVGVLISGATATGNKVMGNYVGTDATGTQDLGNSGSVYILDGANNTIGGTTAGARNVISGNGGGMLISGATATGNKVMGNYIGTDATGTQDMGNLSTGVYIFNASNNTVGGTTAAAGNTISGNNGGGVAVEGLNARGNRILSNSINDNEGLGIGLLANDGVTANDPGDADNGPNTIQNYPVISSATTSSGQITIKGTLNSVPNRLFDLQFFSSPTADPSGFGEGQTLVGETLVDTDANGDASFDVVTATPLAGGQVVSATATDQNGNTSEFSQVTVARDTTAPDPPVITGPQSNSFNTTGNVTLSGTAEASSKIQIFEGTTPRGTLTTANSSGSWSKTLTDVTNGSHTYRAKATDAANNTSGFSNARTVVVDTIKPRVVGTTTPPAGATGVAPTTNVMATFSEAMSANTLRDPTTLRSTTFTLRRAGTATQVAATVSYNATTKTTTLNPDTNLRLEKTYIVTVTTDARDLAGNQLDQSPTLAGNQPKTWSFTVRS